MKIYILRPNRDQFQMQLQGLRLGIESAPSGLASILINIVEHRTVILIFISLIRVFSFYTCSMQVRYSSNNVITKIFLLLFVILNVRTLNVTHGGFDVICQSLKAISRLRHSGLVGWLRMTSMIFL